MLSTSTSQSPSIQHNLPIPVDGRCIVVQMPSMEEMRREVADITCQMQSVYLEDEVNLDPTEVDTNNQIRKHSNGNANQTLDSPNKKMVKLGPRSPILERESDTKNSGVCKTKSNTIGRVAGIGNEMVEAFPIQSSMSSSLPREEQVSEEFVIDGKRYRQTYQRRVVLERKTTRDIFFLPSSSGDQKSTSAGDKSFEYSSPSLTKPEAGRKFTEMQQSNLGGDENDSRPRLDLTVLHKPSGADTDATCLTPAVIMRPVNSAPENIPNSALCNEQKKTESNGHATVFTQGKFPEEHKLKPTLPAGKTNHTSSESSKGVKHSRSRYLVKEMVEAVKKQVACNLRRTKSILTAREQQQLNRSTSRVNSLIGPEDVNENDPNSVQIPNIEKKQGNRGRHELVGYMYKFGVWDDQAPVLDPRLPVAIGSSVLSQEGVNGTVIANPPEWHHAEVGLNESGPGVVRGRVVACLQRFTQHSSASGKALHRSTYVQQTRLVRQRNQEQQLDEGIIESVSNRDRAETKEKDNATADQEAGKPSSLSDQTTVSTDTGPFLKCSNDRLQLLQSLCPAAAAATILLGRQFSAKPTSFSDNSDSEFSEAEEAVNLGETRVVVTAPSWCPKPLIAADLSPYLIFTQTHTDQTNDSSPTVTRIKSNVDKSQPLIRGGTLDGLIAYALGVLRDTENAQHLNALFPHVFRVTYPTFTIPDRVIEKLIQVYIAYAPLEPGCQSNDWTEALTAAEFLVNIVMELHPEQLNARLVLRLARFARLLILDGLNESRRNPPADLPGSRDNAKKATSVLDSRTQHKILADRLFDSLPLLSASAQLRERTIPHSKPFNLPPRRNSTHVPRDTKRTHETCPKPTGSVGALEPVTGLPLNKWSSKCLEISNDESPRKSSLEGFLNVDHDEGSFKDALNRAQRFTEVSALAVATELTRMEEEVFAQINFHEFLDVPRLERGEAHTLSRCVAYFNQVTRWARSLLFVLAPKLGDGFETPNAMAVETNPSVELESDSPKRPPMEEKQGHPVCTELIQSTRLDSPTAVREKHSYSCLPTPSSHLSEQKCARTRQLVYINLMFCHICEVLKHLKQLKNFSSFLALLLAVQELPEAVLFKRSKTILAKFSSYMKPPMFTEYRRDLEAASLPYLPYLGLIFQQLIHLHAGNPAFLSDVSLPADSVQLNTIETSTPQVLLGVMAHPQNVTEHFVNMWRCWKHYLILGYFIKRRENPETGRHRFQRNAEIEEILSGFQDRFSDTVLDKAKEQMVANAKMKKSFWTNSHW